MLQIGRRIVYNKSNGEILKNTGERMGDVIETTIQEDYPEYNPAIMDVIELTYGERLIEFINMGSYVVDPITKQLMIYPKFTYSITNEKPLINETVTITVSGIQAGNVSFIVDGVEVIQTVNEGIAIFDFVSNVEGIYKIEIKSEVNGMGEISLEVIA